MSQGNLTLHVRNMGAQICIIDIQGEVNGAAEAAFTNAYTQVSAAKTIILNFTGLEYMNSSGIGLLVTLLIRAQRQGQKLTAFGLTSHYRDIFELTRLSEAIVLFDSESDALASLHGMHN